MSYVDVFAIAARRYTVIAIAALGLSTLAPNRCARQSTRTASASAFRPLYLRLPHRERYIQRTTASVVCVRSARVQVCVYCIEWMCRVEKTTARQRRRPTHSRTIPAFARVQTDWCIYICSICIYTSLFTTTSRSFSPSASCCSCLHFFCHKIRYMRVRFVLCLARTQTLICVHMCVEASTKICARDCVRGFVDYRTHSQRVVESECACVCSKVKMVSVWTHPYRVCDWVNEARKDTTKSFHESLYMWLYSRNCWCVHICCQCKMRRQMHDISCSTI